MAKKDFWADTVNINIIVINRHSISVYRTYTMEIAATDINSIIKFSNIPFIITDIKRYKAILNYL